MSAPIWDHLGVPDGSSSDSIWLAVSGFVQALGVYKHLRNASRHMRLGVFYLVLIALVHASLLVNHTPNDGRTLEPPSKSCSQGSTRNANYDLQV